MSSASSSSRTALAPGGPMPETIRLKSLFSPYSAVAVVGGDENALQQLQLKPDAVDAFYSRTWQWRELSALLRDKIV